MFENSSSKYDGKILVFQIQFPYCASHYKEIMKRDTLVFAKVLNHACVTCIHFFYILNNNFENQYTGSVLCAGNYAILQFYIIQNFITVNNYYYTNV